MILPFLDEPSTAEELAKRLIADPENEREVCDVASRVIEGVGTKLIERERDGYDCE